MAKAKAVQTNVAVQKVQQVLDQAKQVRGKGSGITVQSKYYKLGQEELRDLIDALEASPMWESDPSVVDRTNGSVLFQYTREPESALEMPTTLYVSIAQGYIGVNVVGDATAPKQETWLIDDQAAKRAAANRQKRAAKRARAWQQGYEAVKALTA